MTVYRAAVWVRDYLESDSCTLSQPARIMAQYIASKVDERAECFPGNKALAKVADVVEKNVYRYVNELVAAGVIERASGGGRGHATTFRFPFVAHPAVNGDRPVNGHVNPRAHAVENNPQPPRPRGGLLSTTPAPTRGVYPEPPRQESETPAPARLNPRAHADPSRKRSSNTEVARVAPLSNDERDLTAPPLARANLIDTEGIPAWMIDHVTKPRMMWEVDFDATVSEGLG